VTAGMLGRGFSLHINWNPPIPTPY
jgi:hypothetical protein